MTQKSEVVEIPLPDLFAGPLGRAQIFAIKFAEGISTIEAKMTIIDKMNELNQIIDNKESTPGEVEVAEALMDELFQCFLLFFEDYSDEKAFH